MKVYIDDFSHCQAVNRACINSWKNYQPLGPYCHSSLCVAEELDILHALKTWGRE